MREKMRVVVTFCQADGLWFAASLALPCLLLHSSRLAAQILGKLPPLPSITVTRASDGLLAKIGEESLHVSVCSDSVIHVVASPKSLDSLKSAQPWMLDPRQSCPGAKFQFAETGDTAALTTVTLKVEFSLTRGNLKYSNIGGEILLRESDAAPRTYEPDQINGESTYHITERFSPDATEGFYGLGQHQSGMFNYRGSTVELGQNNTDVAIPLLVSSKDLEFYHDREGRTNYQQNIDTFRRHFAEETRVRRELVEGAMQVYPLMGYGAVELCIQRFYTTEKGKAEQRSATSRLINLWRYEGGKWTLERVISYDHR
jgi:alpha-glucosidase (family GH31 glycosyl hydrolase)